MFTRRSILRGIASGALLAAMLSILPAAMDWYQNPGGIFRGDGGTHWGIVLETLLSWLWPLTLFIVPVAIVVYAWLANRKAEPDVDS